MEDKQQQLFDKLLFNLNRQFKQIDSAQKQSQHYFLNKKEVNLSKVLEGSPQILQQNYLKSSQSMRKIKQKLKLNQHLLLKKSQFQYKTCVTSTPTKAGGKKGIFIIGNPKNQLPNLSNLLSKNYSFERMNSRPISSGDTHNNKFHNAKFPQSQVKLPPATFNQMVTNDILRQKLAQLKESIETFPTFNKQQSNNNTPGQMNQKFSQSKSFMDYKQSRMKTSDDIRKGQKNIVLKQRQTSKKKQPRRELSLKGGMIKVNLMQNMPQRRTQIELRKDRISAFDQLNSNAGSQMTAVAQSIYDQKHHQLPSLGPQGMRINADLSSLYCFADPSQYVEDFKKYNSARNSPSKYYRPKLRKINQMIDEDENKILHQDEPLCGWEELQ